MVPLTILSLFAIFFGYIAKDLFVGIGSDFSGHVLFTHPSHISLVEAEFGLPHIIKILPAIVTFMGAGLAVYLYHAQSLFTIQLTDITLGRSLYSFFNGKYYIDVVYNHYIMYKSLGLGYTISKVLDRGIIEIAGPQGLSMSLTSGSLNIAKLDTGNLTDYALYMGISLVGITSILFSPILLGINISKIQLLLVLFIIFVVYISQKNITISTNNKYYMESSFFSIMGVIILVSFVIWVFELISKYIIGFGYFSRYA